MHKNTGFTLIEVLIAVLVLAVGLLGLAGVQASSLRNNQSAYSRSQATQLAYDIADKMRANPEETNKLATSAYVAITTAVAQASCNNTTGCTSALMAQDDLAQWHANISSALPGGTGTVTVDALTRIFTIKIISDDDHDSTDTIFQTKLQL